jgi:hypothetical protein
MRTTDEVPTSAFRLLGASGTETGVAEASSDAALVPTVLVTLTVKKYSVPFWRPATLKLVVSGERGDELTGEVPSPPGFVPS